MHSRPPRAGRLPRRGDVSPEGRSFRTRHHVRRREREAIAPSSHRFPTRALLLTLAAAAGVFLLQRLLVPPA